MRIFAALVVTSSLVLGGCAATVQKDGGSAPFRGADAPKRLVMSVKSNPETVNVKDWGDFRNEWRDSMKEVTDEAGFSFAILDDEGAPDGREGTLVRVYVKDYRYLSVGMRIAFGIMTGNAFVEAKVVFIDEISGSTLGERNYNTTSSAWQGVGAPMTRKQLNAICREVLIDAGGKPKQP